MAATTESERSSPWSYVIVAGICALASVGMYFTEPSHFAPRGELVTSQGIIIAIERLPMDDDLALRLSDSERWYTFPYVEDEGLRAKLRASRPRAIVTVTHAPPGEQLPDAGRHYVSAYALAIDGNDILTYEQSKAGYDSQMHPKWLAAFAVSMAALFAVAAWRSFRARAANPESG